MNQRYILTPNNLFYQLIELTGIINDQLPDDKWSRKEIWSKETENAFNIFKKSFYNDLEKTKT